MPSSHSGLKTADDKNVSKCDKGCKRNMEWESTKWTQLKDKLFSSTGNEAIHSGNVWTEECGEKSQ